MTLFRNGAERWRWWTVEHAGAPRWLLGASLVVVIVAASLVVTRAAAAPAPAVQVAAVPSMDPSEAAEPVLAPIPAGSSVLFLGDSYTAGTETTDPSTQSWPVLTSKAFGWKPVIQGVGGSGYTWGGGVEGTDGDAFIDRLDRYIATKPGAPAAVVVEGSQNDWRATPAVLQAAVEKVIQRARSAWPKTQVIVFGPVAPQPLGDQIERIGSVVIAGADQQRVASVDPLAEEWLTTENSAQYDFDHAHVNVAGHRYLAQRLTEDIKALQKPQ